MNEQVNQKVWKITINKVVNAKSDLYKSGVDIKEHKIIGISDYKICIDNPFFSTFHYIKEKGQRKSSIGNYLNEVSVSIKTREDYFGNGVFIDLYSTKKPTKSILDKMVVAASVKIDKEYGFLFNGVKKDLHDMVDDYKL